MYQRHDVPSGSIIKSGAQGDSASDKHEGQLATSPDRPRMALCLPPPKRVKHQDSQRGTALGPLPLPLAHGWRLLPLPSPYRAQAVSCGRGHCLILVEGGGVFSVGDGAHGQLGHGDPESTSHPVSIEALEGIPVQQVVAGGWHSALLSASGDVYTFGRNHHSQLGGYGRAESTGRVGHWPTFVLQSVEFACRGVPPFSAHLSRCSFPPPYYIGGRELNQ